MSPIYTMCRTCGKQIEGYWCPLCDGQWEIGRSVRCKHCTKWSQETDNEERHCYDESQVTHMTPGEYGCVNFEPNMKGNDMKQTSLPDIQKDKKPVSEPVTSVKNATLKQLQSAFSEWDRRFRVDPGKFQSQAARLLTETPESYGEACAPYFMQILTEVQEG